MAFASVKLATKRHETENYKSKITKKEVSFGHICKRLRRKRLTAKTREGTRRNKTIKNTLIKSFWKSVPTKPFFKKVFGCRRQNLTVNSGYLRALHGKKGGKGASRRNYLNVSLSTSRYHGINLIKIHSMKKFSFLAPFFTLPP